MRKFFVQGVLLGLFCLLHFTMISFIDSMGVRGFMGFRCFRFSSYCFADTNVGGPIRKDTVWSRDKSPYIVKSSFVVMTDATLTIEPGVEVRIQEGKAVQIDGALIARGTAEAKIVFTADQPSARWGYILFTDSSVDATFDKDTYNYTGGSILEHCVVEYASGGDRNGAVVCDKASPFLNYCRIRNNTNCGVIVRNGSDFIITNCIIEDNTHSGVNIGVSGSLTIISSTFHNNSSKGSGGGISAYVGNSLTITSCTITNNSAATNGEGGGIYASIGGLSTITSCTITNNLTSSTGHGGGIYVLGGGSLSITSCTIDNNYAAGVGGVAFNASGALTITSSTITRNRCDAYGGSGGGIMIYDVAKSVDISSCTVSENTASYNGGGIWSHPPLSVSNCTVINNNAPYGWGGGIALCGRKNYSITSTTIANNSSTYGGGIYADGDTTISHCTIYNNTSTSSGGGFGTTQNNHQHNYKVSYTLFMNNSTQGDGASLCEGGGPSSLELTNNTFFGSKGDSVIYLKGKTHTITDNNISLPDTFLELD